MKAAEIAAALGRARREGRNWRCLCPVHRGCSLTLRDGSKALLVKCWAGCNSDEVLAELRQRGLLDGRSDAAQPSPVVARGDDRADAAERTAWALRIWHAARDARGSPVAGYLAGRGITPPPPQSVRWAPSLR